MLLSFLDLAGSAPVVYAWVAGAIISLSGLIVGYKAVHTSLVKPIIRHIVGVNEMVNMIPQFQTFFQHELPKITAACKQVQPNGGTSLADEVKRISFSVARLADQQEYTSALAKMNLEASSTPIFICDTHGSNEFVNPSYCEMLGRDSSDLMLFGWKSFVYNFHEYNDIWRDAFQDNRSFRCSITFINDKNEPIYCALQVSPLRSGSEKRFLGMMQKVLPDNKDLITDEQIKASVGFSVGRMKFS